MDDMKENRDELNSKKIDAAFNKFRNHQNLSFEQKMALDRAVFICLGGSRAYGTQNDVEIDGTESDVDLRGVFIGFSNYYLGLHTIEQVEIRRCELGEKDTLYEFRKFIRLAIANNPNIIEQLFLRPEHMLFIAPEFEPILRNRDLFLSKKCRYSYSGYAFAELKRISGHYEWLTNPPTEPRREDYEITYYRQGVTGEVIPEWDYVAKKERIGKILRSAGCYNEKDHLFEQMGLWIPFKDVNKSAWDKANKRWEQYQTWRKERNKARAKLEAAYGYDTKHAAHLIRLLLQCRQILKEKTLSTNLNTDDLDFVQSVKAGKLDYSSLIAEAEKLDNEIEYLYETSDLRREPELNKIEEICVDILKKKLWNE